MSVRAAIAVGLVVVAGVVLAMVSESERRWSGTNSQVVVSGRALPLAPGRKLCQNESIPRETSDMRVYYGTRGRAAGPVVVRLRDNETGERIARARIPVGVHEGAVHVPLEPDVEDEIPSVEICFINRGRTRVQFAGNRTPPPFSAANPTGIVLPDVARIDFFRPGEESGWALAGVVAERFGYTKATFFGSWTMWAVFAVLAVMWILVIRALPRMLGR
jgi:hypothetical protein